ncbi:hypothetical protein ACWF94_06250 [Streptomyces sp. NPDC055078]
MRTRTTTLFASIALLALTACGTEPEPDKPAGVDKPAAPTATADELTPEQKAKVRAAAGFPEKPTGQKRADLLASIDSVAPDAVRYEDKAIDAARNQCSSINGGGNRLDWLASQRFTYKDVTTTEAQGKAINAALKESGFCKV